MKDGRGAAEMKDGGPALLKDKLIDMNACREAVKWVGERDLKTAWTECERPDWMLWLAGRSGISKRTLVAARAAVCAEQCAIIRRHIAAADLVLP